MDYAVLERVLDELVFLPGARVDRVFETERADICMVLHGLGKKSILLIGPDRSLPRFHLVSEKPSSSSSLRSFTQLLKSRITGGRIERVALLNEDRIVELRFIRQGTGYGLLFEMTGSSTNLLLVDENGTILAVLYPVTPSSSVGRMLVPGIHYELPIKKQSAPGRTIGGGTGGNDSPGGSSAGTVNRESELLYRDLIRTRRLNVEKNKILSALKSAYRRTERRSQALANDAKAAAKMDEYKHAGDLILANLNMILPGSSEAELQGYDGEKMVVALDPKRSPAGNAEHYFKKYRKARSGGKIIADRQAQTEAELAFLAALLIDVERAETEEALLEVSGRLTQHGYLLPARGEARVQKPHEVAGIRREYYRGWEILIGKSAAGNDHISTRIADREDLWLHAEGMPGSHVLIRNPERTQIPPEVLRRAACRAAYHSKGRNAGKVAVTYTQARFVKKPKGAKPGLVTLSTRSTIMAVPCDGLSD